MLRNIVSYELSLLYLRNYVTFCTLVSLPLAGQAMTMKGKSSDTGSASAAGSELSFDELLRIKSQYELILQAAGEGVFGLDRS